MSAKCTRLDPELCSAYNGKTQLCEYVPWCTHKGSENAVTPHVTYRLSTGKRIELTEAENAELMDTLSVRRRTVFVPVYTQTATVC